MVTSAVFDGNGGSGLSGWAYSALTNAYNGTLKAANTTTDPVVHYTSVFPNMWKQKLIKNNMFAMAVRRDNGSQVAFGGLPRVNITHKHHVKTPIVVGDFGFKMIHFYAIKIDGYTLGSQSFKSANYAIVDAGYTTNQAPANVVKAIAAQFDPPGHYDKVRVEWLAPCNATAPETGVIVAGKEFKISPKDLLIKSLEVDGFCTVAVNTAEGKELILGDPFLKNVVAAFDVGAGEMRFWQHHY